MAQKATNPTPSAHKGNIIALSKLDGPEEQKAEIFRHLGDLDQYELLDDECLVATYAESNILSQGKDIHGKEYKIIGTDNRAAESRYQGKAVLLVKMGPTAFQWHNNGQEYTGIKPKVGDWVVIHPSDGREIFLHDPSFYGEKVSCRRLKSLCIFMRVRDPRAVL